MACRFRQPDPDGTLAIFEDTAGGIDRKTLIDTDAFPAPRRQAAQARFRRHEQTSAPIQIKSGGELGGRQPPGSRGERFGAFGPHQKSAQAANPEIPFAIGQDGAPLISNDTGFAAENFDAFRPQAAQTVTAAKPHHTRRIDVHAVSRAIGDFFRIRVMAKLVALAPRLTGIQSVRGRHV